MEYIKKFVDIPELPPEPPNFLIGSFNELMLSQQIITHDINVEESLPSISQVEATDNVMSATLIELQQPETTPIAPNQSEQSLFDITFGTKEFEPFIPDEQLQSTSSSSLAADERDILIEQLMREIVELKEKVALLEEQNEANQELLASLKMQLEQKDKELLDIKEVAEQACNENVQLKQEIEEKSVMSMAASDEKSKALEQKFVQLRDVYQKLRNEHIQLLRNNGEIQKKLNKAESDLINEESSRMDLEKSVTSLNLEIQKVKRKASDDSTQMSVIMESLKSKEIETSKLKESTSSLHQQLQDSQQANIQSSIVQAIEQSKIIISKTIGEIDNSSLTCTPGHLLTKIPNGQSVINGLTASFSTYSKDPTALGSVLANISSYTQSMNEIILYGAAAGRLASADKEQNMTRMCKDIGNSCIELLDCLKAANPNMEVAKRLSNGLVKSIGSLSVEAEELKKELDAQEESTSPLGDVVEEEMAVTSLAVNEAAQRIEEILKRSRTEQTGVNLEVNSRILTSCTDLMKAIQMLMTRSRELQQEIVAEGMGTSNDTKDFYKKNNTWSEGLISAAKQVGYGASRLVDTADKVVRGDGKFEALIVNSHDIAASTAQLVAASKVKARAKSEKLQALKSSSRTVSEATGSVVASAQSGAEIKAEAATKIDFTKLSLNQTKRLEMESQVKALELEKELEMERKRLAELRKVHYHKAGASEGWDEEVTS
jgi:huntingtin interacting protein 1